MDVRHRRVNPTTHPRRTHAPLSRTHRCADTLGRAPLHLCSAGVECVAPHKLLILKDIIVISVLAVCVFGGTQPARAQIHTHKDANGNWVLSNDPKDGAVRTAVLPPFS